MAPLKKIVDFVMEKETDNVFVLISNTRFSSDIAGSNHKIGACYIESPLDRESAETRRIRVPMVVKKKRKPKDRAIVRDIYSFEASRVTVL